MRAALVAGPKVVPSLPGDPSPVVATVKPRALRTFWSMATSALTVPSFMLVVKLKENESLFEFVVVVVVFVVDEPLPRAACTFAIVALLAPKEVRRVRIAWICVLERPEFVVVVVVVLLVLVLVLVFVVVFVGIAWEHDAVVPPFVPVQDQVYALVPVALSPVTLFVLVPAEQEKMAVAQAPLMGVTVEVIVPPRENFMIAVPLG